MQIHEKIKDTMKNHKSKVEILQLSVISGISSLVYSEYIARFIHKQVPVNMVMVPPIKNVKELLRIDEDFMEHLSNNLIDEIRKNPLFQKYSDAPELILFNEENVEILKTIFDIYILPNVEKYIPDVISKKFSIESHQYFRESNEIDIFNGNKILDQHYEYLIEEIVLQMISLMIPTMKKELEFPEKNYNVFMTDEEILIIENDNGICPVCINKTIINNVSICELLKFVTNTQIEEVDWQTESICKGKDKIAVSYKITSSQFNTLTLVKLLGIE